jgi:enamine deaminase RidA (YjgF/YER057c/UK114 family)
MKSVALALLLAAPAVAAPTEFVTSPESLKLNRPGEDHVVPGGLEAETRQIMTNIGAVLAKRGLGYDNLFKCTVMLADMKQWGDFNKVYVTYFKPGHFPSRSAFGANGLARNAAVELECWANTSK